MVMNDFGIKDEKDFKTAAKKLEHAIEHGLEGCAWV
jgi:hypothetical protein